RFPDQIADRERHGGSGAQGWAFDVAHHPRHRGSGIARGSCRRPDAAADPGEGSLRYRTRWRSRRRHLAARELDFQPVCSAHLGRSRHRDPMTTIIETSMADAPKPAESVPAPLARARWARLRFGVAVLATQVFVLVVLLALWEYATPKGSPAAFMFGS